MQPNRQLPLPSVLPKSRTAPVLVAFTAALFTSAFLLFAVQPMFARMVLPRLGGSPSVWSVAMVFFQCMLLGGYAYAHVLVRVLRPLTAVAVHLVVLVTAALTLPLSIAPGWNTPPNEWSALWLLGLYLTSIGLPFFALSASNPLLQAWFVRIGHPDAKDPYFLYAASNVGSFLALLAYPILIEPALSLQTQQALWSGAFCVLAALIACSGLWHLQPFVRAGTLAHGSPGEMLVPGWRTLLRWIFMAAVPSGLLVAVTAHISTDIAAAPLLWVIPLALYLLTWVLVFQSQPLLSHRWMLRIQPFAIVGLVALMTFASKLPPAFNLAGHLLGLFLIAMACHGELARHRPPPAHLTTFYMSLSAGGMIGGLFAGLVAPNVFSWIAEYPILLVLAALCRPAAGVHRDRTDRLWWVLAAAIGLAVMAPGLLLGWAPADPMTTATAVVLIVVGALPLMDDPVKFAFLIALALAMVRLYPGQAKHTETVRSFFGVHKIVDTPDGRYRVLVHGTTVHGAQELIGKDGQPLRGRPKPLAYYHSDSPIAAAIGAVRARKHGLLRVAVIGLGTGSLACYVEPGESWQFFEIDQSVVAIARDRPRFTFIQSCAPAVPIVLGDARITLAREPDHTYDLIIVDAYSSDAIPIHLATREAMALYKSKLAAQGVVVTHLSNRSLELESVIVGIAAANGMKTWLDDDHVRSRRSDEYMLASSVAVSATMEEDVGGLAASKDWKLAAPNAAQRTWTDDYADIVGAMVRKLNYPSISRNAPTAEVR